MNVEKLIADYVTLRDHKAALKKQADEKLAKYTHVMEKIEQKLLAHFNETGSESARTKAGTAYRSERMSVRVEDPAAFRQFIESQAAWDMLDARASKSGVETYIQEHDTLPPGVSVSRALVVRINRA